MMVFVAKVKFSGKQVRQNFRSRERSHTVLQTLHCT
jgi:hypothetical protein